MKKMYQIGKSAVALGLTAMLLTGCFADYERPTETITPTSAAELPQESAQPTATPAATEEPQTTATPNIEIQETLDAMSGWGQGTAGSSMTSVYAAYDLLLWSDANQAQNLDSTLLQRAIADWLKDQPEELRADLGDNWHTVSQMAKGILAKEDFQMEILEDAERGPIESETIADNWAAFCRAADAAFQVEE